jgi:hypothetical protein
MPILTPATLLFLGAVCAGALVVIVAVVLLIIMFVQRRNHGGNRQLQAKAGL